MKAQKSNRMFVIFALMAKMTKLVKLVKFGKIFLTFFTMCLSAFVYSFMMGIWFSIGFVLLLFVHEMGHVIALKIKKLPASAPVFIPLLGAAIFSPNFGTKEDESFVGFGGPFLGALSCLAMFFIWKIIPNHPNMFLMLGYTATIINLFNLVPIRPLDGGRITQILGTWFLYVGIASLLIITFFIREPVILFVWILSLGEIKMNDWIRFLFGVLC